MKNKKNIQILQRILSKSDQIMDDIVNLTMQLSAQSSLYKGFSDKALQAPENPVTEKNDEKDYRNLLIEQLKESAANNLYMK